VRVISAALFIVALVSVVARAQSSFVVRDVRLFDGERVTEHRSVLFHDGVIHGVGGAELAVPMDAHVIDGRGRAR